MKTTDPSSNSQSNFEFPTLSTLLDLSYLLHLLLLSTLSTTQFSQPSPNYLILLVLLLRLHLIIPLILPLSTLTRPNPPYKSITTTFSIGLLISRAVSSSTTTRSISEIMNRGFAIGASRPALRALTWDWMLGSGAFVLLDLLSGMSLRDGIGLGRKGFMLEWYRKHGPPVSDGDELSEDQKKRD
jgi:hypothetical protein